MKTIRRALLVLTTAFCMVFAVCSTCCSSTNQQGAQTVLSGIVTVTVDLCDVAQNLTPPPGQNLIALVCRIAGAVEQTAQIFIDQDVWAGMQASYMAVHGTLPTGMQQVVPHPKALQPTGTGLPTSATDAGSNPKDAAPPKTSTAPKSRETAIGPTGIEVHYNALPME